MTIVSVSFGYERFKDGCDNCHDFFDNTSWKPNNTWPDDKHSVHLNDMLDGVCDACHLSGDNRNPYLNQSNGTQHLPGLGTLELPSAAAATMMTPEYTRKLYHRRIMAYLRST
jgi:hypothetical protein